MDHAALQAAAAALNAAGPSLRECNLLVGFDGFVDEIIHLVRKRESKDRWERIETIREFGERVLSAAGKSSNVEMMPVNMKIGGNGPLMAMGASGMGCRVTCVGLLGWPEVQPVFEPLVKRCAAVFSLGNPGHTDAVEFLDGKIMMGKLHTIAQMNWKRICEVIGEEKFVGLLRTSDLVACTNWTMLTEIREVFEQIIRLAPAGGKTGFFFDLADPEKRPFAELQEVLSQIRRLNDKCPCVLGVNLREAEQTGLALGLKGEVEDGLDGLKKRAQELQKALGIRGVVIHSVKFAGAVLDGECDAVAGPYCARPSITTGAGDHFNGGFCAGLLAKLPLRSCLYTGVGTSGWYVRNGGVSPSHENVVGLLRAWAAGKDLD